MSGSLKVSLAPSSPLQYDLHRAAGAQIGSVSSVRSVATSAANYEPNPMDPMDAVFAWELRNLDAEVSSLLLIARGVPGQYYVDGRSISVCWSGPGSDELIVRENDIGDASAETPLLAYLAQVANVKVYLNGRSNDLPAVARVPQERRLTFPEDSSRPKTKDASLDSHDRCELMRLACDQADLRELGALALARSGG